MAEQKLEWEKTADGHRAEWQGWVFEITTEDGGVFCFELNGVVISCEMSRHTLMDEAQVIARAIAAYSPSQAEWRPVTEIPTIGRKIDIAMKDDGKYLPFFEGMEFVGLRDGYDGKCFEVEGGIWHGCEHGDVWRYSEVKEVKP